MSEKKNEKPQIKKEDIKVPNNVVNLADHRCSSEGCKAKPSRAGFCNEHYVWFKEGLITIDGYKAKDFEKKYQQFLKRRAA